MTDEVKDMSITLQVPGSGSKGYLRRMMALSSLLSQLDEAGKDESGKALLGIMVQLVDFLEPYIVVSNGTSPREALLDLSEDDFNIMLRALREGGSRPLSDTPSDASSVPGEKESEPSASPSG